MVLFLSFANGLECVVLGPILERSSPTTLIVRPNFRSLDFLTGKSKITAKNIDEIQRLPGIRSVGRQVFLGFPNSLRLSLFGIEFDSDVPVFGVDAAISGLQKEDFANSEPIPVVISPRLVDLFNSSFANAIPGITHLAAEAVIGQELTLVFGKSSFFNIGVGTATPLEKPARIVGISAKVPPIGVSIPLDTALAINTQFGGTSEQDAVYNQLYVDAMDIASIPSLQTSIQGLGLAVQSFAELGSEVRIMATTIRTILLFGSAAILLIAFFSLFSLISISIIEQTKNIGILRALGGSKAMVFAVFLSMAGCLSVLAAGCGIALGYGVSRLINHLLDKILPDVSFLQADFFPFTPLLVASILGGVVFAALAFAVFPAKNAADKDPLTALWG